MINQELTTNKYGGMWQLIFFHNSTNKVFFDKASEEVLFINTPQKYSTLGLLTDNFKRRGYFEFLLEYPEMKDKNNEDYYIHWLQRKNPIKTPQGTNIGYVPIHVPDNSVKFEGLTLSAEEEWTFLDPSTSKNSWYYAIGSFCSYALNYMFPGPYRTNEDKKEIAVSLAKMYIRIKMNCTCKAKANNLLLFIFFHIIAIS